MLADIYFFICSVLMFIAVNVGVGYLLHCQKKVRGRNDGGDYFIALLLMIFGILFSAFGGFILPAIAVGILMMLPVIFVSRLFDKLGEFSIKNLKAKLKEKL